MKSPTIYPKTAGLGDQLPAKVAGPEWVKNVFPMLLEIIYKWISIPARTYVWISKAAINNLLGFGRTQYECCPGNGYKEQKTQVLLVEVKDEAEV